MMKRLIQIQVPALHGNEDCNEGEGRYGGPHFPAMAVETALCGDSRRTGIDTLYGDGIGEENMMKRKLAALSIAIFAGYLGASPTWAQSDGHRTVTTSDLEWTDATLLPPGAKIAIIEGPLNQAVSITARLKFPANYEIPAHWHPAVERATVLSGTFYIGMGDKLDRQKTAALPAGSVSIMPANMHHFAWTEEETILQLNTVGPWGINYVNPADDPRRK